MANLPTMSESRVSRNNSLEKVLPVMAKDISIMKNSLIKFMRNQTSQQSKAEAYFQRAKQKENLYEARKTSAIKSSSSPSKSGGGSGSSGTGLFDSKVGIVEFYKRLLNGLIKGLLVGGAVFGIKKLLEDPENRKNLGNFLKDIFVGILGLIRDGANLFAETLQKNGPEIQKALTQTFVAIMGAIEASINSLTDLLTGPNSKEIYDSIGRVFTAIGNAIVKVFKTKIDINGVEVSLGLIAAGLIALPALLRGFSDALRNATSSLLSGGNKKGVTSGIGGIIAMIMSGVRLAVGSAIAAYGGAEAYNAWKKNNPDRDSEGNVIDPKSQIKDSVVPGAYNPKTGYLDSEKLAIGAAEVAAGGYVAKKAIDLIKSGKNVVSPGSPAPNSGFPRSPSPIPSPPVSSSPIIVPEGNSPRSSTTMGKGNVFPMEANTAGRRAPVPPESKIAEKIVNRINTLYSKGSKYWGSFLQYLSKRVIVQYGTTKALAIVGAKITGAVLAVAATPVSFGLSNLVGYGLLAADLYFLYTVIEDFFKEQKLDTSPTQAVTDPAGDQNFRDQMVQGANSPRRSTEESIDTGDARSMAENYLGRKMSDKEWDELVRATYAEGSGKSTEEYAMIMAAILNRSRMKGGKNISEILNEQNQFQAVTGTKKKPGPSSRYISGPGQRDFDMITQGTGILSAISTNLDSFTSANRKSYGEGTDVRNLDKLLASGGKQVGGSVFAEGLYLGGKKPAANAAANLRLDSNQVNAAETKFREVEDGRKNTVVNFINSLNTENKQESKQSSGTSAPVSAPWNEEMFFRDAMKGLF